MERAREQEVVVVDGEVAEVPSPRRERITARAAQILNFVFGVFYALIAIRWLLDLIGANRGAGFYRFIYALSVPLLGPFEGLVRAVRLDGSGVLYLSYLIALVFYMLLHMGIYQLMRLIVYRRVTV
ncbi:MAG: YggT family protein [Armatimonadetes bacterium]|nr:YggT family protein [Armatimonadota bacterium]